MHLTHYQYSEIEDSNTHQKLEVSGYATLDPKSGRNRATSYSKYITQIPVGGFARVISAVQIKNYILT